MPVADGHAVPDFGWSPLAVMDSPQDAEDGNTWRHPHCARLIRCSRPARYLVNRTRICRWMGPAGSSMTAYAPTLIRSWGRDKPVSIRAIGDALNRLGAVSLHRASMAGWTVNAAAALQGHLLTVQVAAAPSSPGTHCTWATVTPGGSSNATQPFSVCPAATAKSPELKFGTVSESAANWYSV
jgi:hypothetical protein